MTFLQDREIDIGNMRAQGYDGASNMSGRHNSVQALMRQHAPDATYIHCKAHLAVVHSCKEPCVRTMMATVTGDWLRVSLLCQTYGGIFGRTGWKSGGTGRHGKENQVGQAVRDTLDCKS